MPAKVFQYAINGHIGSRNQGYNGYYGNNDVLPQNIVESSEIFLPKINRLDGDRYKKPKSGEKDCSNETDH